MSPPDSAVFTVRVGSFPIRFSTPAADSRAFCNSGSSRTSPLRMSHSLAGSPGRNFVRAPSIPALRTADTKPTPARRALGPITIPAISPTIGLTPAASAACSPMAPAIEISARKAVLPSTPMPGMMGRVARNMGSVKVSDALMTVVFKKGTSGMYASSSCRNPSLSIEKMSKANLPWLANCFTNSTGPEVFPVPGFLRARAFSFISLQMLEKFTSPAGAIVVNLTRARLNSSSIPASVDSR